MIRRIAVFLTGVSLAATALASLAPSAALAAAPRRPIPNYSSGTLVLRGAMSSAASISMTGALSVGHLTNLDWDLLRPTSIQLNGYSEHVNRISYRFNVAPDSAKDVVIHRHPERRFHWNTPPANTIIRVIETVHVTVQTDLSSFTSNAAYPLASVPGDVAPYLKITPLLQLPRRARALARQLGGTKRREQAVVEAVANWVASHTSYNARTDQPYDAAWVLANHQAACQGYADAMAALLRYQGIPAQVEYGWVSSAPFNLPGPARGFSSLQWGTPGSSGNLHVWLNIYFPGTGWVPFDPQREKFFIDPRHFAFFSNVDAGDPGVGTWRAEAVSGFSPTVANLRDGTDEILPGDGISSQVTVRSRDRFHVNFRWVRHDVSHVLLFSR